MSAHPAARVADSFGHTAALEGLFAGMILGAAIGVGIVATGGLGTLAIGAMLATTGIGAAIGRKMEGPDTGIITKGSPNVFINGLPAAMVGFATGECSVHGQVPVVTGSATVFINGRPAARATELMSCNAKIRSGSPNVLIGGPRYSPICSALRSEQDRFEHFRIDAQAASAVYNPKESRIPPDGYRNATEEDLKKLGLNSEMIEHPRDRANHNKPTDFRAAVFINGKTGVPLVAFKGTTSLEDWKTNFSQGVGNRTFYYDQAQKIARQVALSPMGAGAHLTGHSLGGGLAAAAARASGLPATTFNAAGLHAKTVPHSVNADIDQIYVNDEVLHEAQSWWLSPLPEAAETRNWPLDPPSISSAATNPSWKVWVGALLQGTIFGSGADHFMDNVNVSLTQRMNQIRRSLEKNGCL